MNWTTARAWVTANLRLVIPIFGIILFVSYLFFGGSSGNSSDQATVGGGFGTFIASMILFWLANKASGTGSKVIGAVAILLLLIWVWPRFFPFLNIWGFAPNLILILAILTLIWIYKGGKDGKIDTGLFGWRMFLFIFLVICWIGAKGVIFKDSFNAFLSSTGIEMKMPNIKVPQIIKNATGEIAGYAGHFSAQKISQSKERLVKNGAKFYDYDNTNFTEKSLPNIKDEFIKVFILDEQVTKDGLTFEKVRIGDPATGEDAWVYSGILLTSPTASSALSTTQGKPPEWEKVKDCQIFFQGRVFDNRIGPNGEEPCTGEVYTECSVEVGYDYKITFAGDYTKYLTTQSRDNISWRGWSPQSEGIVKPFPEYEFGALMLRIGNKDGLHPEKDKDFIVFSPKESARIFAELNVNREEEEYLSSTIGSKIKNSTLSIKLERRPL